MEKVAQQYEGSGGLTVMLFADLQLVSLTSN